MIPLATMGALGKPYGPLGPVADFRALGCYLTSPISDAAALDGATLKTDRLSPKPLEKRRSDTTRTLFQRSNGMLRRRELERQAKAGTEGGGLRFQQDFPIQQYASFISCFMFHRLPLVGHQGLGGCRTGVCRARPPE